MADVEYALSAVFFNKNIIVNSQCAMLFNLIQPYHYRKQQIA